MKVKRSKQRKKPQRKRSRKNEKTIILCQNGFSWFLRMWTEKNVQNVLSVKTRLSAHFNVDYRLEFTSRRVCRGRFGATLLEVVFWNHSNRVIFKDSWVKRNNFDNLLVMNNFFLEWGNLVPDLTKNGTDEYDCPNTR